jgi:hypothetical protein
MIEGAMVVKEISSIGRCSKTKLLSRISEQPCIRNQDYDGNPKFQEIDKVFEAVLHRKNL